ncbi:hypothetical protein L873DRAFT_440007 [Choiromyces venosus 120613-1]|uniref:Uncharacterized protein n=1 Tax=Choiromyces venosus 120613-1 TaxID=1336337 RepID=A0A3N4J034_9PEZI|nr:hypothetical protein L873DRAFT_440007 [Choiromyces venosus 120613-1]
MDVFLSIPMFEFPWRVTFSIKVEGVNLSFTKYDIRSNISYPFRSLAAKFLYSINVGAMIYLITNKKKMQFELL